MPAANWSRKVGNSARAIDGRSKIDRAFGEVKRSAHTTIKPMILKQERRLREEPPLLFGLRRPLRDLSDVFVPVLEIGLEVGQEFAGVGSIDDAVIETKREALARADADEVVAILVGDDLGFLVEAADAEYRAL